MNHILAPWLAFTGGYPKPSFGSKSFGIFYDVAIASWKVLYMRKVMAWHGVALRDVFLS
jgi:hypothetical protein